MYAQFAATTLEQWFRRFRGIERRMEYQPLPKKPNNLKSDEL